MRMPFLPISTNQPRKPTMKSLSATVRPAPARPRNVPRLSGGPKITSRMSSTPTICSETRVTGVDRLHAAPFHRRASDDVLDPTRDEEADEDDREDHRDAAKHAIDVRALLRRDDGDPAGVDVGQLVLVVDAVVEHRARLLARGLASRLGEQHGRRVVADVRGDRVAPRGRARLHAVMALLEGDRERIGGGLGLREQRFLVVQRLQRFRAPDESARLDRRGDDDAHAVGASRRRVVLLDHVLHAALRISAGATEILARVVDFVLVERGLRLREIEAVVERLDAAPASPSRAPR